MDEIINLLKEKIEFYKQKDLYINDNDSQSIIRRKDIDFGSLLAYEEILRSVENRQ